MVKKPDRLALIFWRLDVKSLSGTRDFAMLVPMHGAGRRLDQLDPP